MGDLSVLLDREYSKLNSPECREEVLRFISENKSVAGLDEVLIKRLVRTANHILLSEEKLTENLLEKIYNINIEGARILKPLEVESHGSSGLLMTQARFHSQAGATAHALFKETGDLLWAKKAYAHNKISADLGEKGGVSNFYIDRSYEGDAAKALFKETRKKRWALRWHDAQLSSAKAAVNLDKRHAGFSYRCVGDAAKESSKLTKDSSWTEHSYNSYKMSFELLKDTDKKHASHILNNASFDAEYLFSKTGNLNWAVKWYNDAIVSMELMSNFSSRDAVDQIRKHIKAAKAHLKKTKNTKFAEWWYGLSLSYTRIAKSISKSEISRSNEQVAYAADNLFEITKKIRWVRRSYDAKKISAKAIVRTNPLRYAQISGYTGDVAAELYRITGEGVWANRAIDCYSHFLGYFAKHPDENKAKAVRFVKKKIQRLNHLKRS